MMKKVFLYSLLLISIEACSDSPAKKQHPPAAETVIYTDLTGRQVKIPQTVNRIILLRSKDIYSLAALLGDELTTKLIAWGPDLRTDDKQCYDKFVNRFPALRTLPETGSIYTDGVSAEQLLSLHPDLIIADKFILDRGYKYVQKLEEAGLPVIYLDGSSDPFTGSQQGIKLLGRILGKQPRADSIVNFVDSQLYLVQSRIEDKHPRPPTVYLEAGSAGPGDFAQTYGSTGNPPQFTSWGAILHRLQVTNIAEGVVGRQEKISPELILRADPSIIIITGQDWTTATGSMRLGYNITKEDARKLLAAFTSRPGWNGLAAVKEHHLYSVFHNTAVILCFSSIQALAKDCYPTLFVDIDPESNLKRFFEQWLPVSYSGTWMTGPL